MTLLSDEAERLIREGCGADCPPPERLRAISRRLLPKLAAGGAVAFSAAKATAFTSAAAPIATKAAAFGAGSLVSSLLVGGAAGAAVVVAGALWRAPAPREIPSPARVAAPGSAALVRTAAPPIEATTRLESAPQTNAEEEPKSPPPAAALPTADSASNLAAEVHLLNGAQHWISAGDGPRALAIIDRYLTEHPKGALREELLAARVLAWCLSGDHGAARDAARAFVAKSPRSPLLPRLARSCAADVEGLPAAVDSATDSIGKGD